MQQPHNDFIPISIKVKEHEVLCLHMLDEKRRYRDVTTTWEDGDHRHDTFKSKDDVYYTPYGWEACTSKLVKLEDENKIRKLFRTCRTSIKRIK